MADIEMRASTSVCRKCGTAYSQLKGNFPVSYGYLYKGVGYLPYCKRCVEGIYADYLSECKDPEKAARQVCRKLDIYWNAKIFDNVSKKDTTRSVMTTYLSKTNSMSHAGKSYDDTLREENSLWKFSYAKERGKQESIPVTVAVEEPTDEVIACWGPGYTPEMYAELEQRLQYYRSQMGDTQQDMGTDALLRQIVMLEIDINKARAEGRDVDKKMSTFNSLLSSLVKPMQKKEDMSSSVSNTPFGVWIKRWEDERPVPEIDDSLKDVDGIIKYILTWVYGHVAHMLKVKNANTALYDDAIKKYRVERPEYNDEEDEVMLYDIFKGSDEDDDETG